MSIEFSSRLSPHTYIHIHGRLAVVLAWLTLLPLVSCSMRCRRSCSRFSFVMLDKKSKIPNGVELPYLPAYTCLNFFILLE